MSERELQPDEASPGEAPDRRGRDGAAGAGDMLGGLGAGAGDRLGPDTEEPPAADERGEGLRERLPGHERR